MVTILIENPWITALYGWVVGNIWLLSSSKDPFDEAGKNFNISEWWSQYWDNALLTFTLIPLFVMANEWVFQVIFHDLLKTDVNYHPVFNGCVMPVYQFIYKKIRKK